MDLVFVHLDGGLRNDERIPTIAFLMELAIQLQKRGAELHFFWLPRLHNIEADALTKNDTARFDPSLRMRFDLSSFTGVLLREFLEAGTQVKKAKAARGCAKDQQIARGDTLRGRDPKGYSQLAQAQC